MIRRLRLSGKRVKGLNLPNRRGFAAILVPAGYTRSRVLLNPRLAYQTILGILTWLFMGRVCLAAPSHFPRKTILPRNALKSYLHRLNYLARQYFFALYLRNPCIECG